MSLNKWSISPIAENNVSHQIFYNGINNKITSYSNTSQLNHSIPLAREQQYTIPNYIINQNICNQLKVPFNKNNSIQQSFPLPSQEKLRSFITVTNDNKELDCIKIITTDNDIIIQLKEIDHEANKTKNLRMNIETRLINLENDLKLYEQKLKFKDELETQLKEIIKKEERFVRKRTNIIDEINIKYDNSFSIKRKRIELNDSIKCEKMEKTINKDFNISKKKRMPIFYGFPIEEQKFAPKYLLNSFQTVIGQKLKEVVIKLMAYNSYLFASFSNNSVRRYCVEDQETCNTKNYQKYDGHKSLVFDMKVICANNQIEIFHLYTACDDCNLRRFDINTGTLLKVFDLKSQIYCIEYSWSHLFVGLKNGYLIKVKFINEVCDSKKDTNNNLEIDQNNRSIEKIRVANKFIKNIKAVQSNDSSIQPLIVVSNKTLRIINSKSGIKLYQRFILTMPFDFQFKNPVHVKIFDKFMYLTFSKKQTERSKTKEENNIYVYDLGNIKDPFRQQSLDSYVTSIEFNKQDIILTCYDGEIRCFDANKQELKWIAYHDSTITASVNFCDRIVVSDEHGNITSISLDKEASQCDMCFLPFARKCDKEKHIKREH